MIHDVIIQYDKESTVIIQGGAQSADTLARIIAEQLGYKVETYRADWNKLGNSAGPIRNQRMIDEGHPDIVIAFFRDVNQSPGTWDMVRRAKQSNIPVEMHHSKEGSAMPILRKQG